jgi:catechol 2,3-dioxygenase-like lactoylglutathione lyase family enzyme
VRAGQQRRASDRLWADAYWRSRRRDDLGVLDGHRDVIPTRGGHGSTRRAALGYPLVLGDRRWRRWVGIDQLTAFHTFFGCPGQRPITALTPRRLDPPSIMRIIGQPPGHRGLPGLFARVPPRAGASGALLRRLLTPRCIRGGWARGVRRIQRQPSTQLRDLLGLCFDYSFQLRVAPRQLADQLQQLVVRWGVVEHDDTLAKSRTQSNPTRHRQHRDLDHTS